MNAFASTLRNLLVIALLIGVLMVVGGCSKQGESKKEAAVEQKDEGQTTATAENLKLAYGGELKRVAWYDAFAKQAQKENMGEVAVLFRALSASEKVHVDNMAKLLKDKGVELPAPAIDTPPAGKAKQYLKLSASNETVEVESMYGAFAQKAELEGDSVAARVFKETMEADARHGRLLKRALEQETNISRLPYMMCPKCGYIIGSEKDEECRVCKAPKATFKKI